MNFGKRRNCGDQAASKQQGADDPSTPATWAGSALQLSSKQEKEDHPTAAQPALQKQPQMLLMEIAVLLSFFFF